MIKLLERTIEAARRLSASEQDDIARAIMQLAGADETSPVPLAPEERDAIANPRSLLHAVSLPPTKMCALYGPGMAYEAAL